MIKTKNNFKNLLFLNKTIIFKHQNKIKFKTEVINHQILIKIINKMKVHTSILINKIIKNIKMVSKA